MKTDIPCFVDTHQRSAPFRTETKEKWICGGRERWGEQIEGEEGRETVAGMQNK